MSHPSPDSRPGDSRTVVFLASQTLGQGPDELGGVLIRSFLKTLKEARPLPWRLILINTGVRLALDDSPVVTDLREMGDSGVEILSCGTCLDYFQAKDRLRAGRVSNMGEIVDSLLAADRVVRP